MRGHPEVRHRGIPWTGYRTQGRQEELVYCAGDSVEQDEGDDDENDVLRYPRQGEGGERSWGFHSDNVENKCKNGGGRLMSLAVVQEEGGEGVRRKKGGSR